VRSYPQRRPYSQGPFASQPLWGAARVVAVAAAPGVAAAVAGAARAATVAHNADLRRVRHLHFVVTVVNRNRSGHLDRLAVVRGSRIVGALRCGVECEAYVRKGLRPKGLERRPSAPPWGTPTVGGEPSAAWCPDLTEQPTPLSTCPNKSFGRGFLIPAQRADQNAQIAGAEAFILSSVRVVAPLSQHSPNGSTPGASCGRIIRSGAAAQAVTA
jgi:hypothetical protein